MILITVNNSESYITGISRDQFKIIRKKLSYLVDNPMMYGRGKTWKIRKYLIDNRGFFPSGLLYELTDYLTTNKLKYSVADQRVEPLIDSVSLDMTMDEDKTPYDEQLEAVMQAVISKRGVVTMPTGTGKSVTMALLINCLKVKTLVIVPSLELKKQLSDSFISYFGNLKHITIENIDSKKLLKAKDYDCLIIDEAHHVAANTYRNLNKKAWNNIFFRFFFTATPFRSRDEEQLLMESVSGRVIYKLDYETSVTKKFIVPAEFYYFELPKTNISVSRYADAYSKLVVHRKDRNELIAKLAKNLYEADKNTLILVKHIEHGKLLQNAICDLGIDVPFAQGINENNKELIEDFNNKKTNLLIATAGVMGEGIDTRACEYVLLAGGGKSKNAFMQQCGRGFRRFPGKESCKIILFKDTGNKWLVNHFSANKKCVLEEYNQIIEKLEIT